MNSATELKHNLLGCSVAALAQFLERHQEKPYRAKQVIQWLHQHGETDFAAMSNLSKPLRLLLATHFEIKTPKLAHEEVSSDGVRKWLLELHDGNAIETVFIPEKNRNTLCVSSQIGCALNCSFCSTGKEGFNRNLSAAELMSQIWLAVHHFGLKITNVVFMGMGEPLLNYPIVVDALALLLSDNAYGLSKYRVTLSTSGVVPALEKLRNDSDCALAISLHAARDGLRDTLVPINKKYPLKKLIATCKEHYAHAPRRHIMMEYVMLKGVNDTARDANELIRLLSPLRCKINLIPFNSYPGTQYTCSSEQTILSFQKKLSQGGLNALIRKTRGDSNNAACGQLVGQIIDRTGRHERWLKTGQLAPKKQGS